MSLLVAPVGSGTKKTQTVRQSISTLIGEHSCSVFYRCLENPAFAQSLQNISTNSPIYSTNPVFTPFIGELDSRCKVAALYAGTGIATVAYILHLVAKPTRHDPNRTPDKKPGPAQPPGKPATHGEDPPPPRPEPPTVPDHPESPHIKPDFDPDLPESPGPPLSDPESPHGSLTPYPQKT